MSFITVIVLIIIGLAGFLNQLAGFGIGYFGSNFSLVLYREIIQRVFWSSYGNRSN